MLALLCETLAQEGRTVSVVARGRERLDRLASRAPAGLIRPLPVDYRSLDCLEQNLLSATRDAGPIDRAVCWMHSNAPEGPLLVARHVQARFCHVLASASEDSARPDLLAHWRERFAGARPDLEYRAIVLGFVHEGDRSRWLSDAEISSGVKYALERGSSLSIVGSVTPWSARPGMQSVSGCSSGPI